MGDDLQRMGFPKGTKDIIMVTKKAHSGFYPNEANYLTVSVGSDGRAGVQKNTADGALKEMGKAVAVCTWVEN